MKKVATKKTRKVAMSAGSRKVLENNTFGKEPVFPSGHSLTKMEIIHACNWYNYMLTRAEVTLFVKNYFRKRDPKIFADLERTDCQHLLTSHGWTCRMIDNGYLFPDGTEAKIRDHVLYVIGRYSTKREKVADTGRGREKSDNSIADIESFLDSGETFSVYDYLTTNATPKNLVLAIIDFYSPMLDEMESVVTTKDKDLKEGYRHLNAKALKALISTYQAILDDCNRFITNKQIVRKPRAKKVVSLEKKVAKVQFLDRFDPLQIVSKQPSAIIGAKEVWLFNAKYKTVTKLVSKDGFEIKGTTIINIDMENSSKKTSGRLSKTVVDTILKAGKVQLRKVMDEIKGVVSEPTGRINKDVLILRTN